MHLEVRKATLADIAPIANLITGFASKGIMLPRTEFELAESIRDFTVVLQEGRIAGCGALHIYTTQSGEVRSLAVDSTQQGSGIGRAVVEALLQEAETFGLASVFAFTYVPGFFSKLGFNEVDRAKLPLKAWKDCLKCPKFQACDEIAVLKFLDNSKSIPELPLERGDALLPIVSPITIPKLVP